DAIVHFVGLLFAQIPLDAGAAQHRPGESQLHGALGAHHADVHGALFPDAIVGEQGLILIDARRKALDEVGNEIEQSAGAPADCSISFPTSSSAFRRASINMRPCSPTIASGNSAP